MYKRFLNNKDYCSIITEEGLNQLTRGNEDRIAQAEEAGEASILEYLSEKYEIEKELDKGKNIAEYDRRITYPVGTFFYKDGVMYEAMRTINGYISPTTAPFWKQYENIIEDEDKIAPYKQTYNYYPGDVVKFANTFFECVECNGIDFGSIRVPGVNGWQYVPVEAWQANVQYGLWNVVSYEKKFYALTLLEGVDLTVNPAQSDNWGLIGNYDSEYNTYEFSNTEYVVFEGNVYYPIMSVNSDDVKEGYNIRKNDPRNSNIKKHLTRLALYELHKLVSPNNISSTRITDYETSIIWLRDASRLRICPNIPRKIDGDANPVTDFAMATFQRDYDPYKNPWQI